MKTKKKYQDFIFLQGEEAQEVLDLLDQEGKKAALNYLVDIVSEPGEISDNSRSGESDDVYQTRDGYKMSWNTRFGYIGLERIVTPTVKA